MNSPAAEFMDARARAGLVLDLQGLVSDPDIARPVTLYTKGARTYAAGSGTATYAETTRAVRAVVQPVSDAEIASGGYVRGDQHLQIADSELVEDPGVFDRATVDGVTYTILDRRTDALGAVHTLTARKAA